MAKRRASYPKELRSEAKFKQRGLLTISLELSNGELLEEQATVDVKQAMFAKWAMAMLFCKEVRDLPDLETMIRDLTNARTNTKST